jgi:hypothetical protein
MLIGEAVSVDDAEHEQLMSRVAAEGLALTVTEPGS